MKIAALLTTMAFVCGSGLAFGQGKVKVTPNEKPKIKTIELAIHPAKEPVPSLRYRLLPEMRDLKTGNAVLRYYRSMASGWLTMGKKERAAFSKWAEDDRKAPPTALRFVLNAGNLREIDIGARRTYCDWDMLRQLRKEGFAMLLPDIQSFRRDALLLAARARFHIEDGKYNKAVYSLQTSLAFSRHISKGPSLIQSLVAVAQAQIALVQIEQLVQKEKAPNLYWALTDLPRPFIDLRRPLQAEKIHLEPILPGMRAMLRDSNAKPMSADQVDTLVKGLLRFAKGVGIRSQVIWRERLAFAFAAAKAYPDAKRFLLSQGRPKKIVDKMPVTQAVLLFEVYNFDRMHDKLTRWYGLPYAQMRKGIAAADRELRKSKTTNGMMLAGLALPSVDKVVGAAYRLDRKIACLRCVEAIRLHAAKHGALPATLAAVKAVPVPLDPITGRPFRYRVKGNTGFLTAIVPEDERVRYVVPLATAWTYELHLKR